MATSRHNDGLSGQGEHVKFGRVQRKRAGAVMHRNPESAFLDRDQISGNDETMLYLLSYLENPYTTHRRQELREIRSAHSQLENASPQVQALLTATIQWRSQSKPGLFSRVRAFTKNRKKRVKELQALQAALLDAQTSKTNTEIDEQIIAFCRESICKRLANLEKRNDPIAKVYAQEKSLANLQNALAITEEVKAQPKAEVVEEVEPITEGLAFNSDEFIFVKAIKSGAYGSVSLYRYAGQDPEIRALCIQDGLIGVKTSIARNYTAQVRDSMLKEGRMADQLFARYENNLHDAPYNLSRLANLDGKPVILTKFEAFELYPEGREDKGPDVGGRPLDDFIDEIAHLDEQKAAELTHDLGASVLADGLTMLAQLTDSYARAIHNIHDGGFNHSDIAARNCLVVPVHNGLGVRAVPVDYGLGMKRDPRTGMTIDRQPNKGPIRWLGQAALNQQQLTPFSDYYSVRLTMYHQLTTYLGLDELQLADEVYGDQDTHSLLQFALNRREDNDQVAMRKLLKKMQERMADTQAFPNRQRVENIQLYLQAYGDYLVEVALPPHVDSSNSPEAILNYINGHRAGDLGLLKQANQNYVLLMLQQKLSEAANIAPEDEAKQQQWLLSVRRLLILELPDYAKATPQYQHLITQVDHFENTKLLAKWYLDIGMNQNNQVFLMQAKARVQANDFDNLRYLCEMPVSEELRASEVFQEFSRLVNEEPYQTAAIQAALSSLVAQGPMENPSVEAVWRDLANREIPRKPNLLDSRTEPFVVREDNGRHHADIPGQTFYSSLAAEAARESQRKGPKYVALPDTDEQVSDPDSIYAAADVPSLDVSAIPSSPPEGSGNYVAWDPSLTPLTNTTQATPQGSNYAPIQPGATQNDSATSLTDETVYSTMTMGSAISSPPVLTDEALIKLDELDINTLARSHEQAMLDVIKYSRAMQPKLDEINALIAKKSFLGGLTTEQKRALTERFPSYFYDGQANLARQRALIDQMRAMKALLPSALVAASDEEIRAKANDPELAQRVITNRNQLKAMLMSFAQRQQVTKQQSDQFALHRQWHAEQLLNGNAMKRYKKDTYEIEALLESLDVSYAQMCSAIKDDHNYIRTDAGMRQLMVLHKTLKEHRTHINHMLAALPSETMLQEAQDQKSEWQTLRKDLDVLGRQVDERLRFIKLQLESDVLRQAKQHTPEPAYDQMPPQPAWQRSTTAEFVRADRSVLLRLRPDQHAIASHRARSQSEVAPADVAPTYSTIVESEPADSSSVSHSVTQSASVTSGSHRERSMSSPLATPVSKPIETHKHPNGMSYQRDARTGEVTLRTQADDDYQALKRVIEMIGIEHCRPKTQKELEAMSEAERAKANKWEVDIKGEPTKAQLKMAIVLKALGNEVYFRDSISGSRQAFTGHEHAVSTKRRQLKQFGLGQEGVGYDKVYETQMAKRNSLVARLAPHLRSM